MNVSTKKKIIFRVNKRAVRCEWKRHDNCLFDSSSNSPFLSFFSSFSGFESCFYFAGPNRCVNSKLFRRVSLSSAPTHGLHFLLFLFCVSASRSCPTVFHFSALSAVVISRVIWPQSLTDRTRQVASVISRVSSIHFSLFRLVSRFIFIVPHKLLFSTDNFSGTWITSLSGHHNYQPHVYRRSFFLSSN